jgi:hypothetical protein
MGPIAMWGRIIADIETVRVAADSWERITTKHTFSVFGDVTVLFWIIILNIRVTACIETLLVDLQYY